MKHRSMVWAMALAMLLARAAPAIAQEERVITGQVTAVETGEPLIGVQISVKGTNLGTISDNQGNFSIRVPEGSNTLVFTSIGYGTLEVEATENLQVALEQQAIGLEGLVVTALGVEREKRTLGYSVQDVSGDELAAVPELNVVNSLQGNVAGVKITNAGPTGGSSRIVIRGASSITGNNQPLFIVDGVPVSNRSPNNDGYGGIDYGNAVQDIHPANIESISVLKGPNAAALYGSRAANGAIVITTKTGRTAAEDGLGLTASLSYTMEEPLRLPSYQNLYGQGLSGEFRWVDGNGGGTWDHVDESWGPRLDGRLIDQFTGPQQPWVAHPDNVRNFFETGQTLNSNVAVARVGDRSHVRLSLTNTQVDGMAPGNSIDRIGVSMRGGADVTDRFSAESSINYTHQNAVNRPGTGYDEDNPMQQFIWFGRQVDMAALEHYRCTGDEPTPCQVGAQYNWNYNYHNNPFWEQIVNGNDDQRDRLIGHVALNYQLTDWLNATARVGRDWYRDTRKRAIHHFSLDDAGEGSFEDDNLYVAETNVDLLLTATRQLTSDFTLDVTAGGNRRTNEVEQSGVDVSRLVVPGIYTIDNAATTPDPYDQISKREVRSLYGSASLNYRGWFNVDVTGRNDWSSTLPDGNNSYFYPSVSSAFVFTDAFNISSSLFSSGKVRASWTRVGSDAAPYQLTSVFNAQQGWGGVPMYSVPGELPNVDLKPLETSAWEIGADLGFFDERLGFVITHYDSRTRNQILGVQISAASGYTSQVLNAGEVRNWGTELLLMANPIRTDRFNWDMTVNWSTNNSQVRELYGDLETLVLGSYWSLDIEARGPRRDENGNVLEYYPYGTMFGNPYLRDDQGRLLLTDDGLPQADPVRRVLGHYSPDWIGGIQNRFSYGAFDLSVLVDGQMGGDIFSVTNWFGEYAGVLESSLRGRENDFCDPGIVVDGVMPDGSINGDGTDDITVCPEHYFGQNFNLHEASIDDASYVKLREVRLGYTIPERFMSRFGFSGGSIALIGRNLALWSKIDNIDPETAFDASNVQGIEFGQFPTARSIGFSFSIRP